RARLRAKPEGDVGSLWIVLDYGDVILHIFDAATREFYDLESLWGDARIWAWTPEHNNPEHNNPEHNEEAR
ncbi:MAG: RsfS/YbeB/iojap family protein, partial [Armatimonadota bacterium]|nr:RsfS/YbeB/iojap family protein [Armatimonadota bacterium]